MEELKSSKIALRPFSLTDADDLMSYAGDDQVTRNLRWNTLTTRDEALTFIKDFCMPHLWCRSICTMGDDRSIGFISVFPGSGDDRCRADFAYCVTPKYWGQGIATEALRMAIPQVFEDWPDVQRLQAFVFEENKASIRVLEKLGFQKEGLLKKYRFAKGVLRDFLLYSFFSCDLPLKTHCIE